MLRSIVMTLDCADLERQTEFWQAVLGYERAGNARQYVALVDPTATHPKLLLQRVDEAKSAKNRLHLDLHVDDIDTEADRVVALGATRIEKVSEFGISWIVMTDPEGNEFCICPGHQAVQ